MRFVLVSLLIAPLFAATVAQAQVPLPRPVETALLGPASVQVPGLGEVDAVLPQSDVDAYQSIFALQEDGHWREADRLIARLQDRRLMGYVLAQRYLHPTKYRSHFKELRAWMANYADLPQARRIYRLAVKRQPKRAQAPRPPIVRVLKSQVGDSRAASQSRPRYSHARSESGRRLQAAIRSRVGRGWPTGALELLDKPTSNGRLTPAQTAQALRDIARSYYRAGKDADALAAAQRAIRKAPQDAPIAYWWGGLAAWRSGDTATAHSLFATLANFEDTSDWMKSAAAFWAARAAMVERRPAEVIPLLERGANFPLTFYGLLSKRALGESLQIDWRHPPIDEATFRDIAQTTYGGRAIALLQVGMPDEAETELTALAASEPALRPGILALASRANFPALAIKLAPTSAEASRIAALYPVPDWNLDDGVAVDRALVYALVRQESGFNERAQSRAGARGLMQLMPRTASFIAGQRSLRGRKKDKLFNPELNLSLGQRYIDHLLSDEAVADDLFRLATAYNAGPGNLRSWERKVNYRDDPLLFIESLPSHETRLFIERVLTNFWIYRDRLGQPSPSLDDVASGAWPGYRQLDGTAQAQIADGQH